MSNVTASALVRKFLVDSAVDGGEFGRLKQVERCANRLLARCVRPTKPRSEDLQHSRHIVSLIIVNPFR
jgi:hypothetical protein